MIVGESQITYELVEGWEQLPAGWSHGDVAGVATDSQDRVYAAVQPDAKIYRIDKDGKSTLFFDPKQKYIWSMLFDKSGNLFVATGETGLIYKVTPDGKGAEFARTEETHARSMILDTAGDLIVGTEPGGLIVRIRPDGETFVLYQTAKREVTGLAEHDGVIYAASVGNKGSAVQVSGPPPVLPSNPPTVSAAGQVRVGTAPPAPAPSSFFTFSAFKSKTVHLCPPLCNRRTMFAPIRPRPTSPSCMSLLLDKL